MAGTPQQGFSKPLLKSSSPTDPRLSSKIPAIAAYFRYLP
jgi:hypothetical protein